MHAPFGANFFSLFRNKNLMNLFKKLCKQNQLWKYNLIRDRLNVCTQRHVRGRKAARDAAVRAHVEAVVEICIKHGNYVLNLY